MYRSINPLVLATLLLGGIAISPAIQADTSEETGGYALYGNWCGPKHPRDPATAGDPIDSLDAICKRHDICYINEGDFSCRCDAGLVKAIRREIDAGSYTGLQYQYARAIHNYFQGSPCEGDSKDKLLPSRLLHRAYNAISENVQLIEEVFADETPAESPDPAASGKPTKP